MFYYRYSRYSKLDDEANNNISPWQYDFLKKSGHNVISFCCINSENWYRNNKFYQFIKHIAQYISIFDKRVGYGASMGAYGLSTYAKPLNIDSLLLFNPISTLNQKLVPFESRFWYYRKHLDWDSNIIDGADTEVNGIVIFDNLFRLDAEHSKRYKNLTRLHLSGVGHSTMKALKDLNMLEWIIKEFIDSGTIDIKRFYQKARKRRYLE